MADISVELRKYQELIVTQAKERNTIAFLPTGTGKTLIACYLIRHRIEGVRIARENGSEWGKIIVFIAPTRALLHQQIEYIQKHVFPIKALEFHSESAFENKPIDKWDRKEWKYFIQRFEVFGLTPDTLKRLIEKSIIPVDVIDLIMFDECHHVIGNSAMAKLCDVINSHPNCKPLIFGMTASPVQSKQAKSQLNLEEFITNLEQRLHANFFYPTEELISSLQYFVKKPKLFLIEYKETFPTTHEIYFLPLLERIEKSLKLKEILTQEEQLKYDLKYYHLNYFQSILNACQVSSWKEVEEDGEVSEQNFRMVSQNYMSLMKEAIHQTIEIIKSSGIYCGLIALSSLMKSKMVRGYSAIELNPAFEASKPRTKTSVKSNEEFTKFILNSLSQSSQSHELLHNSISIDSLKTKTQDLLNYLKGNKRKLMSLLNQSRCLFISFMELLYVVGIFIGKKECEMTANKLRTVLSTAHENNEVSGDVTVVIDEMKIKMEITTILTVVVQILEAAYNRVPFNSLLTVLETFDYENKEYFTAISLVCTEFVQSISLDSISEKFFMNCGNENEDISKFLNENLTSRTKKPVNFLHFTLKLDSLLDTLAATTLLTEFPSYKTTNQTSYNLSHVLANSQLEMVNVKNEDFNEEVRESFLSTQHNLFVTPPNTSSESLCSIGAILVFCSMRMVAVGLNALILDLTKRWPDYLHRKRQEHLEIIGAERSIRAADLSTDFPVSYCSFPLKSDFLVGSSSISQQNTVLKKLKEGRLNLLFTTDVAQEGLDITQCNLILNYDGPKTLIGFIQRRGRARSKSSLLIHYVKSLNKKFYDQETKDIFAFIQQEVDTNNTLQCMYNEVFTESLAELAEKSLDERFYIPSTGVSVDYVTGKLLLESYCNSLLLSFWSILIKNLPVHLKSNNNFQEKFLLNSSCNHDANFTNYMINFPRYFFEKRSNGSYLAILIVPDIVKHLFPDCPNTFMTETPFKKRAKGLVALKAIEFLYRKGEFDDYLQFKHLDQKKIVLFYKKMQQQQRESLDLSSTTTDNQPGDKNNRTVEYAMQRLVKSIFRELDGDNTGNTKQEDGLRHPLLLKLHPSRLDLQDYEPFSIVPMKKQSNVFEDILVKIVVKTVCDFVVRDFKHLALPERNEYKRISSIRLFSSFTNSNDRSLKDNENSLQSSVTLVVNDSLSSFSISKELEKKQEILLNNSSEEKNEQDEQMEICEVTSMNEKEIETNSLETDEETISLYLYCLKVKGKSQYYQRINNSKLLTQLESIEKMCFAFHFPISLNILLSKVQNLFPFYLKCFTNNLDHQDSFQIYYLGIKKFTLRELSCIQLFHKSIFCLQPFYLEPVREKFKTDPDTQKQTGCFEEEATKMDEVVERRHLVKNLNEANEEKIHYFPVKNYLPLDELLQNEFEYTNFYSRYSFSEKRPNSTKNNVSEIDNKLLYDFEQWKSISDGSCYFAFSLPSIPENMYPLGDEMRNGMFLEQLPSHSTLQEITFPYLLQSAKESILMINNLLIIQRHNFYNLSTSYCYPEQNAESLINMVGTTTGKNLVCLETSEILSFRNRKDDGINSNKKKLSDPLRSSSSRKRKNGKDDSLTYAVYFSNKSPEIEKLVTSLLASDLQQPLIKGYPLSGKFTLFNTLITLDYLTTTTEKGNVVPIASTAVRNSSASEGSELFLLPQLIQPIGNLIYFHMIFLLPSISFRLQSVFLANELYEDVFIPIYGKLCTPEFTPALPSHSNREEEVVSGGNFDNLMTEELNGTAAQEETEISKSLPMEFDVPSKVYSQNKTLDDRLLPKNNITSFRFPIISIMDILEAMSPRRVLESINSERMELLGDSFLKYATTMMTFLDSPSVSEGMMTITRRKLISNYYLKDIALFHKLPHYLRILPLSKGNEEILHFPPGHGSLPSIFQQVAELISIYPWNEENLQERKNKFGEIITPNTNSNNIDGTAEQQFTFVKEAFRQSKTLSARSTGQWCTTLRNTNIFLPFFVWNSRIQSLQNDTKGHNNHEAEAELIMDDDILKSNAPQYQTTSVNSKSLADLMESLIAVNVLQEHHEDFGYLFLMALNILPTKEMIPYRRLSLSGELIIADNSYRDYVVNSFQSINTSLAMNSLANSTASTSTVTNSSSYQSSLYFSQETVSIIERKIGYTFQCKELLMTALIHQSKNNKMNYQRLEFLGDAVLDYLMIRYLYNVSLDNAKDQMKKEIWDEGQLTRLKLFFTTNEILIEVTRSLDFYLFLSYENFDLSVKIMKIFEEESKKLKENTRKELISSAHDDEEEQAKEVEGKTGVETDFFGADAIFSNKKALRKRGQYQGGQVGKDDEVPEEENETNSIDGQINEIVANSFKQPKKLNMMEVIMRVIEQRKSHQQQQKTMKAREEEQQKELKKNSNLVNPPDEAVSINADVEFKNGIPVIPDPSSLILSAAAAVSSSGSNSSLFTMATANIQSYKFLADIFESILGAVFVDSSYNLETAKAVLRNLGFFDLSKEQLQHLLDISSTMT
jgi:ERCC4-related helicase/dsRNA-specific ribonuclease